MGAQSIYRTLIGAIYPEPVGRFAYRGRVSRAALFARPVFACLLVVVVATSAASAETSAGPARVLGWVANGPVTGVVRVGSRLLVGGSFTRIGPRTGQAAIVARASGALVSGFPEFAGGAVRSIVADGSGGWYVGGDFRFAGGLARAGLAHVRADLTVDPGFKSSTEVVEGRVASPGGVAVLALAGGTLYVGGSFNRVNGSVRTGLAAVDAESGELAAWDPEADQAHIVALAVSGASVYVSGFFSRIGGAARGGLAALDVSTGRASAWDPAPDATPFALAVAGDTIYVGGSFSRIAGAMRRYLAALDTRRGVASSWAPTLPAPVTALTLDGSTIYAGLRARSPEQTTPVVTAVSRESGEVAWSVNGDGDVASILVRSSGVTVAGSFGMLGNRTRDGLAELATATGNLTDWAPQPDLFVGDFGLRSAVSALANSADGVVIGGDFTSVGGSDRLGLAAVDAASGKPSDWTARLDGRVAAIASAGGRIYLVGSFTRFAGTRRNGAAAVDRQLRLLPWAPPPLDPPGSANNLSVVDGKVLVMGFFNGVAARGHGSLAAFDPRRGRLLEWGPTRLVGNGVHQVIAGNGRIYAIGVSGTTDTVALLDRSTGHLIRYLVRNRGTGDIRAAALAGRTLYIAGAMEAVNFHPVTRLAAVDAATGKLRAWRPSADETVSALLARDGVVYIAGQFAHVNGQPRAGIAAVSAKSGRLLSWDPRLAGPVDRLSAFAGGFFAGGRFVAIGRSAQPFLALFAG